MKKQKTIFANGLFHSILHLSTFCTKCVIKVLQVFRITTIVSYTSTESVLDVIPYTLNMSTCTLLIAGVILFFNWVKQ